MAYAGIGFIELVVVLLSGGFASSGVLGLPPGERDAALLRCPPADVLLYADWAERSSGQAGAEGLDGLAADPEVRAFLAAVEQAYVGAIQEAGGQGREETALRQNIPPLVKLLLNRPGCLYVSFDEKARPTELEERGTPRPVLIVLSGARATLVVSGGEQADEIARHVEALVDLLPERVRTKGLDHQPLPMPFPGMQLVLHRHEDYFILGFGEGTVDQAVRGLSGEGQGLAKNQRFQAALERLSVERTASVSWLDFKTVLAKATVVLGEQGQIIQTTARTLGLDGLEYTASVTGVEEGRVVTRSFVHTGGGTQRFLALAAGRGIKPADFGHVPADADLVFAFSVSPQKVLAAARQIVSEAHPPSGDRFEQLLMQLEGELGVSFEDDVFPAFGDVWTVYDSPGAGGVLFTSVVGCLEVRDAAKAQSVFKQLMKILEQALPGEYGSRFGRRGVYLEHKEFLGREVYYVNTVGDEVPFAPAFCVTDKHLLVAPHPQALKAHLRFADGKSASFAKRVQPANGPAGDVLCYSYVDARRAVQLLYSTVPFWGQVVYSEIQREGGKIDIFSLPSARAILPYIADSISRIVRTENGIYSESHRGVPLPGGAGLLLNLPMFGLMMFSVRAEARAPAIRVNALPPGEERIPVDALRRSRPSATCHHPADAPESANRARRRWRRPLSPAILHGHAADGERDLDIRGGPRRPKRA